MDKYSVEVESVSEVGALVHGSALVLGLIYKKNGTAFSIAGGSFTTRFPAEDQGIVSIANASHTIIEAGANDTGEVTLSFSAANSKRVKQGRQIPFQSEVVLGGNTYIFEGFLDEVKFQLR